MDKEIDVKAACCADGLLFNVRKFNDDMKNVLGWLNHLDPDKTSELASGLSDHIERYQLYFSEFELGVKNILLTYNSLEKHTIK